MTDSVQVRIANGISDLPAAEWDALNTTHNPFTSHAFLAALEQSHSVSPLDNARDRTGWRAAPLIIDGPDGHLAAAMPAYIKTHSQGEYVFDHAWADAWHRAGGDYYPKLQIAVPFTPASGPRLLTRDPSLAPALIAAAETLCADAGLSSAHATFLTPEERPLFEAAGWLPRADIQFHWENRDYATFEDFLADLS